VIAFIAQGQQPTTLNGIGSFILIIAALLVIAALLGKKK
jgi:hypothetical protein